MAGKKAPQTESASDIAANPISIDADARYRTGDDYCRTTVPGPRSWPQRRWRATRFATTLARSSAEDVHAFYGARPYWS